MANISSVGISSGVLTSDLIDKLVNAEREPTENRLNFKEESVTAELSLFGQIQSAVTDLRLPARALANPDAFNELNAVGGGSTFTASAGAGASAGNYTLEVTALAKSHSLSTDNLADPDITTLGTGTLNISIGSDTAVIEIDSSNNTLNGIAAAINEDDTVGVTASVINSGSGFKLVISSDETGLENAIDIQVIDTGDGDNDDEFGLSQLSYTTGATQLTQNQLATDAAFSLNGIAITRSSNVVDDVITGVTLNLSSTNAGAPASLTISRDVDSITEKVSEFVESYNKLQALISENTNYNADNPSASGLLVGDSSTRSINNQIRNILGGTIQGLEGETVRSLAEIGISTSKDSGQLSFNEVTFKSALASNPAAVEGIFADQGRTSDGQIEFVRAGLATEVGEYAINVTQLATRGELTGSVALGVSTLIDDDNNEFTLTVDGVTSGTITLTNGSYTEAELLTEMQSQINADSALAGSGVSVAVTLDGTDQIVITSTSYGSNSTVEINSVDTNTAAQLGLAVGVGIDGLDVEGTINGETATGSGQILTAASDDESEGINVRVTGGALGARGSVSYIEGVGEQLVDLINSFLDQTGVITAKNERLNAELDNITQDRAKLELRVSSLNERLVRQFTAADILIGRLNSTQDFITQQLDAIIGSNKQD